MKFFAILIFLFSFGTATFAQHINKADQKLLMQKEDSLKISAGKIIQGINPSDRFYADSIFTRTLVRALSVKNSFYYPFDSLLSISRMSAPDSSFRIFTWQMLINENIIRQHGAIQMRTADGSLKLFPLIDKSDVIEDIVDTVANNYGWVGAIYYNVILTTFQDKKYYTLLGFDENNIRSNKKIMEVLHFENDKPIFGGDYFRIPTGSLAVHKSPSRFILEYKKETTAKLNFVDDMGIILVEHLISETREPQKKWTYVSDGDFQGFKWVNGKWIYIDNVRNYTSHDPNVPMPKAIRDEKGNIDFDKLQNNERPDSTSKPPF